MSRAFTPKIVTANALLSGEAVYLTEDDRWSPRHEDAEMIEDEARAQLRLLFAESQPGRVVGPYLAEAMHGPDGPAPLRRREVIRAQGPSNYAHGMQVARA
jgi:hypothetical protein